MKEDSLNNFINSIIFLVKLFVGLEDKFFAQKLYDKTSVFIAGYVKLFNSKEGDDQASHNTTFIEFKNTINNLLELLDYLKYSKSVSTTPLLCAYKNILNLKLELIKLYNEHSLKITTKQKENKPIVSVSKNIYPMNLKESSNKERIFNFIKRSPNSRTKEIIDEFNILSERTVKRNLKELTTEGLVRKLAKDKGVYYSAI